MPDLLEDIPGRISRGCNAGDSCLHSHIVQKDCGRRSGYVPHL